MPESPPDVQLNPIDIDSIDDAQIEQIRLLFEREWWSAGRSFDETAKIIRNSQVVVGYVDAASGQVMAFARVVTDYLVFAVVLDVIVDMQLRGSGWGKRLMDDIFEHPDLQELRGIGLQCRRDLVPFYSRWGLAEKEVAPDSSIQLTRRFDREAGERPADAAVGA